MTLSIVLPTIPGRESELARTIDAYTRLTPVAIEWIIERGHDNCGSAWNAGTLKASGEILHMGADDIEPESDAWFPAALSIIDKGGVPLGFVREGTSCLFGRDFCRVVICRREWWQDVPPLHYYSDNAYTDLMTAAGHEPVIAEGFDFYHRKSMVGRDEPVRYAADGPAYEAWRATALLALR